MLLYIATSNPGKLRDFAVAATGDATILPLPGLAAIPAPPEEELTFEGNAHAKALFYSRYAPGQLVLADDSGLEVDALHGAPGVRSARYSEDCGFPASAGISLDERNNACLLQALATTSNRRARYRCVLAAAQDGVVLHTTQGSVEGEMLPAPRGTGGFGYDPLFFVPKLGKTMAELDDLTRLTLSHRGAALRSLLPLLAPSPLSASEPPRA